MNIQTFWRWHSWLVGFDITSDWDEELIISIHLLWLEIQLKIDAWNMGGYCFYCKSSFIAAITAFLVGGNASDHRVTSSNGKAMLHAFRVLDAYGLIDSEYYYCLPSTNPQSPDLDDIPF